MLESLKTVNKAIAGAIVAALVAYLSRHGIVLDSDVSNALALVVSAVLGFVVVYISPKNK
jgi:hypothetical protein